MKTSYLCAECLLRQAQKLDHAFNDWEERYETIQWVIDKLQNSFRRGCPGIVSK